MKDLDIDDLIDDYYDDPQASLDDLIGDDEYDEDWDVYGDEFEDLDYEWLDDELYDDSEEE